MKNVRPGQPYKPPRAADANAIAATVEAYRRTPQTRDKERPLEGTIVQVKNESGTALRRGDVVALKRTALLATTDREHPWIGADKLSSTSILRNAILAALIDPAADDEIVDAQLSGVAMIYVDVGATWHRRARPVAGDNQLASGLFGPVEILIAPTGTGEQLCLCSIGHADNRGMVAKTTSSITAATLSSGRLVLGSGTATIYDPYATTATQYEDASHTATIYSMAGAAVATDGYVFVEPTDDWLPLVKLELCTQPA